MSNPPQIFDGLIGQEHVARFLAAAIKQGPSHAYLFLGPSGAGKMTAALGFAAALCCEQGGCGVCPSCQKAARATHPDIEVVAPTGSFITVDQIREVNRSLNLHPHESQARIYIISDASSFNAESANAFLKSLEEPPRFVFFLLLAGREDHVLPTLVSRCQTVRFGPVPADDIESFLRDKYGVSETIAQAYARVSRGNLGLARALCEDEELVARRGRYLQIGENLTRGAWEGGAAQMAADILSAAQEAGEAVEEETIPEGFIATTKKRQEQDAHRRSSAAQRRELILALDFLESWFRDMMVMASGAGQAVMNRDYELELEDQALASRAGSYRRAVGVIEATRSKLGYNIDLELALQAMFYQLQEVL
ncbi:MAG: DNA polymerase III subunit delta' [Thermoleophilia bacterium]|jgi:DNA polymerase-3 subunit delta'